MLEELGSKLKAASDAYLKKELEICFLNLKGIRNRIGSDMSDKEKESLKILEPIIILLINRDKGLRKNNPLKSKLRYTILQKIDEYNDLIMFFLKKYGYLIPRKEDHTSII
jgi:hypothetical protein